MGADLCLSGTFYTTESVATYIYIYVPSLILWKQRQNLCPSVWLAHALADTQMPGYTMWNGKCGGANTHPNLG